jgi:hypothetical protein
MNISYNRCNVTVQYLKYNTLFGISTIKIYNYLATSYMLLIFSMHSQKGSGQSTHLHINVAYTDKQAYKYSLDNYDNIIKEWDITY